jgi:hypothetical protein
MKQNSFFKNLVEALSFRDMSLRTRLFIAFALIAILPVLVIGSTATLMSSQGLQESAFDELDSVATLKSNEIKDWLQVLQSNLTLVFENQQVERGVFALLQNDQAKLLDQDLLRNELRSFNDKTGYFVEIFVVNSEGTSFSPQTTHRKARSNRTRITSRTV